MSRLDNILKDRIKMLMEQSPSRELNNAPSQSGNLPFTPAEKAFLGKFDAHGTKHLGIIYSTTDIGIREFLTRSGIFLNLTTGILLRLLRKKIIRIVPYTGYGRNNDYTIELRLSLDSIKGWGAEEQNAAEKKQSTAAAGGSTDTAGPSSSGVPVPPPA